MLKENDFLRSQIAALKRQQQEGYERGSDASEGLYVEEGGGGRREYSPHEGSYRREVGNEVGHRRDYEPGYKKEKVYEGRYKRENVHEGGNHRRESAKRYENRAERSPEDTLANRKKTVVKVEPVEFEPKKKDYMPVRTIVNTSNSVTEALNWNNQKRNEGGNNMAASLQQKISELVNEQNRLKSEIERLAEVRGGNASKRKGELELELSICDSNVNSLTAKLRKVNWLSNS